MTDAFGRPVVPEMGMVSIIEIRSFFNQNHAQNHELKAQMSRACEHSILQNKYLHIDWTISMKKELIIGNAKKTINSIEV